MKNNVWTRIYRVIVCVVFLLGVLRIGTADQKVLVAVLDTGYSGTDDRVLSGWNMLENSSDVTDKNGHGSKIINLILEHSGVKVNIIPIKVADVMGVSTEDVVVKGIYYAMENRAEIIHLSMNTVEKNVAMEEAIQCAKEKGIAVVVSAGNHAQDVKMISPANLEDAIVVSAVNADMEFSKYSNYGSTVDFAANGNYQEDCGTSFAAAKVTAILAEEILRGGSELILREKVIDAGEIGKDSYYGYGILLLDEEEIIQEKTYIGKSENDLGYEIMNLDWKRLKVEELDKYLVETHKAYVGMFLSRLGKGELKELMEKSKVLNTKVMVQEFSVSGEGVYRETAAYEEEFVENAIKNYKMYEKQLSVSAEWLMLRNYGQFAVSSDNRADIYLFTINGFAYTVDNPDSPWFAMYDPNKLTVTRTTVKKTTDFGALYVSDMSSYLSKVDSFAFSYIHPETGKTITSDNFLAIDSESDGGSLCYGLSIQLAGYKNKKEGYHTEEEDIIQIPYNYQHTYSQYSYSAYKEPLTYIFSYYDPATNETYFSDKPQRVEVQEKNFKKLLLTNYNVWYNGEYKIGYNFSNVNPALSLSQKLSAYLAGWDKKVVENVHVYGTESSLTDTGFCINTNLQRSLALQWNNGETATIALQNDIPEYNFPLVINTYTIKYNGNGADGGSMENLIMTYNEAKNLAANRFYREGYVFKGWALSANGGVVYTDGKQVKNLTTAHKKTINLYAVWEPLTYRIVYDGNGATEGSMQDMIVQCNKTVKLVRSSYKKNNTYGPSVFLGWSRNKDDFGPMYLDGQTITDMGAKPNEVVTLYAMWDDCPWIIAEDLYFSLKEAQGGFITYEEIIRYAEAKDREAGGTVLPGWDEEKGTEFIITDFDAGEYLSLTEDTKITETYRVTDSSGSIYEKTITVHIVDTQAYYEEPYGTTRFINEEYYYKDYESGGLEENSVWRTQTEYVKAIEEAFENIANDTPIASFSYSYEEIRQMK